MAKRQSRTREARQRRQKQRRQNQRVIVLAAIIVIAVVAIAVVFVSNQPVEAHIPDDLSARYEGIQRSYSRDGYPRLGDPDAPVTVEEYSSFSCPACETFHSESLDELLERVRAGQALFSYVPLQTGAVPNAGGAARAALCAGQQGMFWEMHDVLFDWQTRYGNTAFSQNRLLAGVDQLGLNGDQFTNCFNAADISATLTAAVNEEVSSTPTLRVNGVTLEAAGVPSAAALLQAIDDATPDDWGVEESEVEPDEPAVEEADAEAESADTEPDTDAGDEADQAAADPRPTAAPTDTPEPTVDPEPADADESSDADATPDDTTDSAEDGS